MTATREDLEMARMHVGSPKKKGLSYDAIAKQKNRDPRTVARRVKETLNSALNVLELFQDLK